MIDFSSSEALAGGYIGALLFVAIIGVILWWMKFHDD